ncbi:glycosyltransferase family 4 protein [uncultured Pseudodesulfovibrio sp.]|uniref:glycosyltransferase family 4 protein n=1 Tax=uncultured Pseudodesulfovibrio sp. TaxID=2035858 RepID=UPI0029C6E450|nr:glycosyltransferase family 4 protein [uncultured Pseudodesulfovibrio sp.]
MKFPRTAYVSLWFPKPSETFIFREVQTLKSMGLPVRVFTLYAPLKKHLSPEMHAFPPSESLGSLKTPMLLGTLLRHAVSEPKRILSMLKRGPFNGPRSLEGLGENLWALCCGLHLAKRFEQEGIEHIHAPWAGGPATAAWVASRLTGIPFSFAGRAGDIYPPEGAMDDKMESAAFVRVNHNANVAYLRSLTKDHGHKVTLVYNALTMAPEAPRQETAHDEFRLLAAGRFVPTKGFPVLLEACNILKRKGANFTLTLVGDGGMKNSLVRQTEQLGLTDKIRSTGFLSHDQLSKEMLCHDALVMPSVVADSGGRDGIPNVIMEAYAHGLPVVASDVAGIKEVVIDNQTGFLVPQKDEKALADALSTLMADRENARRLAENGKRHTQELFDPETNCGKLIELFSAHSRLA